MIKLIKNHAFTVCMIYMVAALLVVAIWGGQIGFAPRLAMVLLGLALWIYQGRWFARR